MDDDNYSHDFDRPSQIYTHDEVTPPVNRSTFKSQLAEQLHHSISPPIPTSTKQLLIQENNENELMVKEKQQSAES